TVPAGAFTKIMPLRDAHETGSERADAGPDEIVTRVLPVRHAEAAALVPVLQPLVSKDGVLTAHVSTNRLVAVDSRANVDRLAALLRELDTPSGVPGGTTQVHVVRLVYADSEALVRVLSQLLGLPVPPPEPPRARGSSLMRNTEPWSGPPIGYDG